MADQRGSRRLAFGSCYGDDRGLRNLKGEFDFRKHWEPGVRNSPDCGICGRHSGRDDGEFRSGGSVSQLLRADELRPELGKRAALVRKLARRFVIVRKDV